MELYPYLFFKGDCEEAFDFYAKVFGGKITSMIRFHEAKDVGEIKEGFENKIYHASMVIAGQDVMGSDASSQDHLRMQILPILVSVKDSAEVERVFGLLVEGGKVEVELSETIWSHRYGLVVDRYGVGWMVAHLKTF